MAFALFVLAVLSNRTSVAPYRSVSAQPASQAPHRTGSPPSYARYERAAPPLPSGPRAAGAPVVAVSARPLGPPRAAGAASAPAQPAGVTAQRARRRAGAQRARASNMAEAVPPAPRRGGC